MVVALALVALTGCPDDEVCEPGWTSLSASLPGAALSVRGTAADDVWLVGGGVGLGGAMVRHWDGAAWTTIDVSAAFGDRTAWWVWPEARGVAWIAGERGAIARIDGTTVVDHSRPTTATLFGVWGSGPDDVWFVGGVPNGRRDDDDDLVWRWDGAAVSPVAGVPSRGATMFKIWGAATDDLWISGEGGTMLRWDGAAFVDHSRELATASSVLTVDGCGPDDVWAVAGQIVYRWDGATWARRPEIMLGSASGGVGCGRDRVLVVGNAGLKASLDRATGAWTDERLAPPTSTDLHGAWIDPVGRAWAVGGNYNQPGAVMRVGAAGVDGCPSPAPL